MKLSDAIRLGSMLIPQTTRFDGCAIGAAVHAMGRHCGYNPAIDDDVWEAAVALWPFLDMVVTHPLSGYTQPLQNVIGSLNGYERTEWTRERIADWVETVETALEQAYQARVQGLTAPALPSGEARWSRREVSHEGTTPTRDDHASHGPHPGVRMAVRAAHQSVFRADAARFCR